MCFAVSYFWVTAFFSDFWNAPFSSLNIATLKELLKAQSCLNPVVQH